MAEKKIHDHDFGDFNVFLFSFCIENSWVSCYCFFFLFFFYLLSNKFIDIKKGSTLVHRECTRDQTIKNKNYRNLGNQEKIKMIGSAMQPTNPLKF